MARLGNIGTHLPFSSTVAHPIMVHVEMGHHHMGDFRA